MDPKRIGKALLFPPLAVVIPLGPIATVFLVLSMVFLDAGSPVAVAAYALSAYTLTVCCCRLPAMLAGIRAFKRENKYIRRWQTDTRLRINVSLYGALVWNTLYGVFQLCLGLYHRTFWFLSIGVYYVCLAAMRFFLFGHTRRHAPRERLRTELLKYRACGWVFLLMNLALSAIVFFMVYWGRTFVHHPITAITMAAYTFTAFSMAITNIVKYKKYHSPVFSATKAIGLAAASVSMLTLTSTLLTTFDDGTMNAATHDLFLGLVGAAVLAVVVVMAVYMILEGTRQLKTFDKEVQNGRKP